MVRRLVVSGGCFLYAAAMASWSVTFLRLEPGFATNEWAINILITCLALSVLGGALLAMDLKTGDARARQVHRRARGSVVFFAGLLAASLVTFSPEANVGVYYMLLVMIYVAGTPLLLTWGTFPLWSKRESRLLVHAAVWWMIVQGVMFFLGYMVLVQMAYLVVTLLLALPIVLPAVRFLQDQQASSGPSVPLPAPVEGES